MMQTYIKRSYSNIDRTKQCMNHSHKLVRLFIFTSLFDLSSALLCRFIGSFSPSLALYFDSTYESLCISSNFSFVNNLLWAQKSMAIFTMLFFLCSPGGICLVPPRSLISSQSVQPSLLSRVVKSFYIARFLQHDTTVSNLFISYSQQQQQQRNSC